MHTVLPGTALAERTEQAALIHVESSGVQLAAVDRGIHVRVLLSLPQINVELAKAECDVFIACHIAHVELPGEHAHVEGRRLGNFDSYLEVVVWTVPHAEI